MGDGFVVTAFPVATTSDPLVSAIQANGILVAVRAHLATDDFGVARFLP